MCIGHSCSSCECRRPPWAWSQVSELPHLVPELCRLLGMREVRLAEEVVPHVIGYLACHKDVQQIEVGAVGVAAPAPKPVPQPVSASTYVHVYVSAQRAQIQGCTCVPAQCGHTVCASH